MIAFLLAAGLGTRLRPLTLDRPKALVEINGKPLIYWNLKRLKQAGFRQVIINVHYFADMVEEYLNDLNWGMKLIVSDERNLLRETGGGLKYAWPLFENANPILMCNVDVLTTLDLSSFYQSHVRSEALATLAVRSRKSSRHLLFDSDLTLAGWKHNRTGETRMVREVETTPLAFSGVQVIDRELFNWFPDEEKFSIIDVYLAAAAEHRISAFPHDEDEWLDVGKPESLEPAERLAKKIESTFN
ncbi:MAG: nucleotidyltransferase family protein [Bacteroidota bacterium]